MTPLRIAIPLAAALLVPCARPARADTAASDRTLAEALFRDGKRLMAEGQVSQGCAKLAESQRIAPAVGTLLNLAVCHETEGKTATAWAEFSEAAADAARNGQPERKQFALEHATALEARLSKLVITATSVPADLQLRFDGSVLSAAALGSPIPVDPGVHEIEVVAPHKKRWKQRVQIVAGAGGTVKIPALEDDAPEAQPTPTTSGTPTTLPPAATPAPQPRPRKDEPAAGGSVGRTLGYVSVGVGAVGIAVGSYFGIRTFGKKHDAEPYCNGDVCAQKGLDLRDEAKSAATTSTVFFAVGLAGAAIGTVLLVTSDDSKAAPSSPSVSVAPIVGPGAAGVGVAARF